MLVRIKQLEIQVVFLLGKLIFLLFSNFSSLSTLVPASEHSLPKAFLNELVYEKIFECVILFEELNVYPHALLFFDSLYHTVLTPK